MKIISWWQTFLKSFIHEIYHLLAFEDSWSSLNVTVELKVIQNIVSCFQYQRWIQIFIFKNLWIISFLHIISPAIFKILIWNFIFSRFVKGSIDWIIFTSAHWWVTSCVLAWCCNWSHINKINSLKILWYLNVNAVIFYWA